MGITEDERRKRIEYLSQLNVDKEKMESINKAYELREIENTKLEGEIKNFARQNNDYQREMLNLKKKLEEFRVQNEGLTRDLDIKEERIEELLRANRGLEQECAHKNRLLKEREKFQRKAYINDALEQQRRKFETDIEAYKMRIGTLQDKLEKAEETIETYRLAGTMDLDEQVPNEKASIAADMVKKEYEAKMSILQAKLAKRELMEGRESKKDEFEKELLVGELLIKGLTKENERLVTENRELKSRVTQLEGDLKDEHRKLLQTKNNYRGTVRFNEEEEMKETIQRLQNELIKKDDFYRAKLGMEEENQKIEEMNEIIQSSEDELTRLRQELAEVRNHNSNFVNLFSMKKSSAILR